MRIDAFGARPLQAPVAEAGQSYRIAAAGVRRLERPQMDAVAWADGLIVTRDMRLADFLAEVARYRNGYLGCAAEVADLRLSGVYRLTTPTSCCRCSRGPCRCACSDIPAGG